MKINSLLTMLACAGFAAVAQAGTVTINFQELGSNLDLGPGAKTFTAGGVSLTAQGFSLTGDVDLWAKLTSGDPSETGLGLANDADHEIHKGSFIQLSIPPTGVAGAVLTLLTSGSLQGTETVAITFGDTSGTLGGFPPPGNTHSGGGVFTFTIPSSIHPFLDITGTLGNVLLDSVVITFPTVPDGGMTIMLLGGAVTALGLIRRKLIA
jgi:hypothetical protein